MIALSLLARHGLTPSSFYQINFSVQVVDCHFIIIFASGRNKRVDKENIDYHKENEKLR